MTTGAPRPRGFWLALALMIFGAGATFVYWSVWLLGDRSALANLDTPAYYAYENAFPLADAYMAITSLAGAIALYQRRPTALLWMLLAGSASIYLGLLDVLFDLENGVYRRPIGSSIAIEVAINLLAFAIPIYGVTFAWRSRWELLGVQGAERRGPHGAELLA